MTKTVDSRRKYGLYNIEMPIQHFAAELRADLNTIKEHVYTAGIAWAKCKEDVSNLRPEIDVLTFEDYQRNVELFHCEMPTSMGYGANSQQFALFPVGVRFRKGKEWTISNLAQLRSFPQIWVMDTNRWRGWKEG